MTRADQEKMDNVIQVYPYGIVVGSGQTYPILVLRDQAGEENLPVFLHPAAASDALFEVGGRGEDSGPHRFSARLVEALGYKVERCVFSEIRGQHQYVVLYLKKEKEEISLTCRADEAMPFCLSSRIELYASKNHMAKARSMEIHRAANNIDVLWNADNMHGGHIYLN